MPTPTYTPLANITLGSSTSTVTFGSINQGFRDLVLVITAKSVAGTATVQFRPNGDTGFNYSYVNMQGNGSSTNTLANSGGNNNFGLTVNTGVTNSEFNVIILNALDYSATDKQKLLLVRNNRAGNGVEAIAGRWADTSAITYFTLTLNGGDSFATGSTMALYGIAA